MDTEINVFFVVSRKRVFVCEKTNAPNVEIQITAQDAQRRLNCSPVPLRVCCANCGWVSSCGSHRAKELRALA